jgi:hypothetical protein
VTRAARRSVSDEAPLRLKAGYVVRTSENLFPHFRVIAVSGDRVWIRDVQSGTDHVAPINRCQIVQEDTDVGLRRVGSRG